MCQTKQIHDCVFGPRPVRKQPPPHTSRVPAVCMIHALFQTVIINNEADRGAALFSSGEPLAFALSAQAHVVHRAGFFSGTCANTHTHSCTHTHTFLHTTFLVHFFSLWISAAERLKENVMESKGHTKRERPYRPFVLCSQGLL